MDIEQIQVEINRINSSSILTNEEKIIRTKIFKAYIESTTQEEKETLNNLKDKKEYVNLYNQLETIEQVEQRQVKKISKMLKNILGIDINLKSTEEELQDNYQKAIDKVKKLYIDEKVLDLLAKNAITQMINQLFEYYKNRNKDIPDDAISDVKTKNQYIYKKL